MRQDSWTIHEAVVLLEKYLQYTSGTITRKEAIESASNKLREMAINQGKQIDITFRNVAGITFQLASMESAYLGYTKLKPATKLFAEIVTTYRTNLGKYKHLLCEANAMIYTHYIEWLKNKVSEDTISSFMRAYNEIDEYCCSINLLSFPLLETTDIDAIKGVQANLLKRSGSATSSATHKLAIQCYIQYLQDCSHWNTNPKRPVPVAEPASTISTDQRNKDSQLRNENPVLYDKLYHTLKDLSARGSWGASALMLYEYVGSSISAVKSILDRASWAELVGKVFAYALFQEAPHSVQSSPAIFLRFRQRRVSRATPASYETSGTRQD